MPHRFEPVIRPREVTALAAIGGLLFVVLGGFLAVVADHYEVIAKGNLLPYTGGFIYKIRLFDSIDLYVEPEQPVSTDLISSYALIFISAMSLVFALIIARAGGPQHRRVFWMFMLLFPGAGFLATDEALGIHESIGHNLQFLREMPLLDRPDDLIVMIYLIPVLCFAWAFWREFLPSRAALGAMVVAVAFVLLGAVGDAVAGWFEEISEVAATVCLTLSVLLLGLHHVSGLLAPRVQTRDSRSAPGARPA